jgi:hypothetical protein
VGTLVDFEGRWVAGATGETVGRGAKEMGQVGLCDAGWGTWGQGVTPGVTGQVVMVFVGETLVVACRAFVSSVRCSSSA